LSKVSSFLLQLQLKLFFTLNKTSNIIWQNKEKIVVLNKIHLLLKVIYLQETLQLQFIKLDLNKFDWGG